MEHEGARPAGPADAPELEALATAAQDELAPTRGGRIFYAREAADLATPDRWAAAVNDPDRSVVVGTFDDATVGFGELHIETLATGELLGVVDALFVLPDARGVGIGETMMDQLIAFCEARGCVGIDAVALPGNRATKNFFETFGLVARAILVHRSFREEPMP